MVRLPASSASAHTLAAIEGAPALCLALYPHTLLLSSRQPRETGILTPTLTSKETEAPVPKVTRKIRGRAAPAHCTLALWPAHQVPVAGCQGAPGVATTETPGLVTALENRSVCVEMGTITSSEGCKRGG